MERIHIVTDSGSDLPEKVREELGIHVVPLSIQFGDDIYRDGEDLSVTEFYTRLEGDVLPSTCQPSPADFERKYREIAEPGDTIISVHLSSRLSGTYQSAVIASNMVAEEGIKVVTVDTKSASIGIGLVAVAAAQAVKEGLSLEGILERVNYAVSEMHVFFVVDTLEFLRRNGRIGNAAALVGTLLNIKPILTLQDGVVTPLEKIRGKAKAVKRIQELAAQVKEKYPGKELSVGLTHAMVPGEAQALADAIKKDLGLTNDIITGLIGPTIGVHVGKGTMAVLIHPKF